MGASPGLSGLGLGIAALGGLMIYTGVTDTTLVDAGRSLLAGVTPTGAAPKVTTVTFAGATGGTTQSAGHASPGDSASAVGGSAGSSSGAALVAAATRYLGVPYRWGGTSPTGLDCSGLLVRVFNDAHGVKLPRTSYQQAVWSGFDSVPRGQAAPGDVAWWPGHVALVSGPGECIHAPRPGKVVTRAQLATAGPVGSTGPSKILRWNGKGATSTAGTRARSSASSSGGVWA